MSSPFSITTASNHVTLHERRASQATYTVANAAGHPLTGRAALETVPKGAAHRAWLTLQGDIERAYSIGGVEQYTVDIQPPPDAQAGEVAFRLVMVGTHNPDETYTPGPTVVVTLTEPPAKKQTLPVWLIPAIVGAVAVIAVVAWLLLRSQDVTVPNVVELPVNDALATLEAAQLLHRPGGSEFSDSVPAGLVARIDPGAGAQVEKESAIFWYVSDGAQPTPTPTPTIMPTPTVTPTPVPQITDGWVDFASAGFTGQHPPDWNLLDCLVCSAEVGLEAFAIASDSDPLISVLKEILAGGSVLPIDYGADGIMVFAFNIEYGEFGTDAASILQNFIEEDDFVAFPSYETLESIRNTRIGSQNAITTKVRGFDESSGRVVTARYTAALVGTEGNVVVLVSAPLEVYSDNEAVIDAFLEELALSQ